MKCFISSALSHKKAAVTKLIGKILSLSSSYFVRPKSTKTHFRAFVIPKNVHGKYPRIILARGVTTPAPSPLGLRLRAWKLRSLAPQTHSDQDANVPIPPCFPTDRRACWWHSTLCCRLFTRVSYCRVSSCELQMSSCELEMFFHTTFFHRT